MIQKSTLSFFHYNINKNVKTLNSIHYDFFSHKNNNQFDILKLVVIIMLLLNSIPCKIFSKLINPNFNQWTIHNHIHNILPLNTLYGIFVKNIIDYIIENKEKIYFDIDA